MFTTFSRTTEPRKRARTWLPADGRAPRGFTLTELLAVLAIVLVVVAGSIGVWLALAETIAPGQATAVVQAMLAGARDYAVSNGVMARVVFKNDLADVERGTEMYFEYDADRNPANPDWQRIPGRRSEYVGSQVFVLSGAPDLSGKPVPSVAVDEKNPDPSDVKLWQEYRDWVAGKLAEYATGSSTGYLGDSFSSDKFYVTFDATGTLALDLKPGEANPTLLTTVQVAGAGRRVGEYRFYILNANTGTQLVFE